MIRELCQSQTGAVAGSTNGSTIKTTVDLLGRTIGYEDVWSQSTTTSYDPQTGRVVSINGPLGLQQPVFDTDGRLDQSKLAGSMLADPSYVPGAHGGDLSSVAFPSGVGNASNATGSGTRRVVGLGMVTYYASAATFHIAAGDSAVKTAPAVSCGLLAASIV